MIEYLFKIISTPSTSSKKPTNFQKLQANGWTNQATALTNMKNQWKAVFLIRIDDMFTTMSLELKESILGIGNANRYDLFSQKIEDVESNLYDFIKVE